MEQKILKIKIDFTKGNGLVPVIIQDNASLKVLMLGFMNEEALAKSLKEQKITFYSRTKNRLWTKGEISGNYLFINSFSIDCDNDTLLFMVNPAGPVCHRGTESCFDTKTNKGFLYKLEQTISGRIEQNTQNSYTNALYKKGIEKVAQKVGEEAVELVIEALRDKNELFINEAADLLYHFLVLLKAKGFSLEAVEEVLSSRAK